MMRMDTAQVLGLFLPSLVVLISACLADDHRTTLTRRDNPVWTLSSLPSSNDATEILRPFGSIHRMLRHSSLNSISTSIRHSNLPALRIHYARGSRDQHGEAGFSFFSKHPSVPKTADAMILKYDVFFEDFDFGLGGKLPGLFGGNANHSYYCREGNNPDPNCFSLRLNWLEHGEAEIAAYIPLNQSQTFYSRGDVTLIDNNKHLIRMGTGGFHFENNKWHTVSLEVHMNTVNATDGWFKVCVEVQGQSPECYTSVNLNLRNSGDVHPEGLMFETHFGGTSHMYGAPQDCATYFNNFEISIPTHTPLVIVG